MKIIIKNKKIENKSFFKNQKKDLININKIGNLSQKNTMIHRVSNSQLMIEII